MALSLAVREPPLPPQRLTFLPLCRAWRGGGKEQGVICDVALVISAGEFPGAPSGFPCYLSLRDVLGTKEDGMLVASRGVLPEEKLELRRFPPEGSLPAPALLHQPVVLWQQGRA